MRSHKVTAILGLFALAAFGISMVGCGSDSPTSTAGSLTDPAFMAVQDQVDNMVDSTLVNIVNGFENLSNITNDGGVDPVFYGPVKPDSDLVSVTYADGWHVVVVSRTRATFQSRLRDSVQFFSGDAVTQLPNNTDSLYYRHQWQFTFGDTAVTHAQLHSYSNMTIGGLQDSIANIAGQHEVQVQTKHVTADSTVWRNFTLNSDINDLQVAKTFVGWAQGCPNSGTITGTVAMSYRKDDSAPVQSTWEYSLSFSNGTMSATVTQGTTTWRYTTDVCTSIN